MKDNLFILFITYGFHPPWNEGSINILKKIIDSLEAGKKIVIFSIKRFIPESDYMREYKGHPIYYISPPFFIKYIFKLDVELPQFLKIFTKILTEIYVFLKVIVMLSYFENKQDYVVLSNVNHFLFSALIKLFFRSKVICMHYSREISVFDKVNCFSDFHLCTVKETVLSLRSIGKKAYYFMPFPQFDFLDKSMSKQTARSLLNLPTQDLIITYIGNLSSKRFPPELLNILRLNKDFTLLLVAPNTYLNNRYVLKVKELLKNQTNIKLYLKNLTDGEKFLLLKASDFVILPFFSDGINVVEPPLLLLETLASGCIPIVAQKYSMNEIITDGLTGFIVKNLDELSRLLERIRLLPQDEICYIIKEIEKRSNMWSSINRYFKNFMNDVIFST